MIDRFFFAAALVAACAAAALAAAEQIQVMAGTQVVRATPEVVQLERVVIRAKAEQRVAAAQAAGVEIN